MPRATYSGVVATLALVIALTGTAFAAGALPKNSVGARQLKNQAVKAAKIKPGAVRSAAIADGSVKAVDLDPTIPAQIAAAAGSGSPFYVHQADTSIQQVGMSPEVEIGVLQLPQAGRYSVTVLIRAFRNPSDPGASINCSLASSGGRMSYIVNAALPPVSTGNVTLPMSGWVDVDAGESLPLRCNVGLGGGQATVSYWMDAVKIQ